MRLGGKSCGTGELMLRSCRVPVAKGKVTRSKIADQSEVEEEPYSGWSEEDDEKKTRSIARLAA